MQDSVSLPLVSVIMPVRNEAAYIRRSLEAVLAQDYPAERIEVIVADGGSTDGTRQVIGQLQTRFPQIRLIDNPGKIVSTGLNLALAQARGEIIVRVDGHCEIASDYVRRCVEHLRRDGAGGVGGSVETIGENWMAQSIALAMSTPFGVGGSAFRTLKERTLFVDTVPFPAYSRSTLAHAGPFDEELVRNQDDEYNYRLRKLGYRILLAADVRSKYYSRSSLRSVWQQYYQYGYWKVRVFQKHPRQMRLRQFIPPALVAGMIASAVLGAFFPPGRLLPGLLIGAYLLANLTASAWTAARRGWQYLPALPLIYAALHLSYGVGFLVGLARFAHRWGDRQSRVWTKPDAKATIESEDASG